MELIKVIRCHFKFIFILCACMSNWECKADTCKQLPFKFVSSEYDCSGSYCVVQDSSLQKGVYSIVQDSLVIPCIYEDVSILGKGYFDVTFRHKAINMHCLMDSLGHRYAEVCDYIKWDSPTIIKAMNLEDDGYYINITTKEQRKHTGPDAKDRYTIIKGFDGKTIAKYYCMESVRGDLVWINGIISSDFVPIVNETQNDIEVLDDNVIAYQGTGKNKKWGLWNIRANTKTPALFDDLKYCSDGLYSSLFPNGKWGVIDISGKTKISPLYDTPIEFNCGYAVVNRNGKQGVIRTNGSVAIDFAQQRLNYLGFGLYKKTRKDGVCICNGEGKSIISSIKNEDLYPNELHKGFVPYNYILNDKKCSCYYNSYGLRITDGKYQHVCCFDEQGYAMVKGYNGLWGVIDENMHEVVPCNYEQICCFSPFSHKIIYIKENKVYIDSLN